jgi:hypothetical protein
MSDDQGDQTEAELERTRKVVAESMAEQVAANNDAAAADVTPEDEHGDDDEDLSSLPKAELVDRAERAGIDTGGKTKAELVAELEGSES